jgi:hypothetical protein
VDNNEAASSRGDKALESRSNANLKKPEHTHTRTAQDAVLTGTESKTHLPSAVDKVIKTLWDGSSSYEDIADQTSICLNHEGRANRVKDHLKQPDVATSAEIAEREDLLLKRHVPFGLCKDQSESLQAQGSSHEREVTPNEQGRRSGQGPSR